MRLISVLCLFLAGCGGSNCQEHVTLGLYGNSIMVGMGDPDNNHLAPDNPLVTLKAVLEAKWPGYVTVNQHAVGGTVIGQIQIVPGEIPVVLYGTNEALAGTGVPAFKSALSLLPASSILVTPPPMDTSVVNTNHTVDDSGYAQAVRDAGFPFADVNRWFLAQPNWQSGLIGGVHPADAWQKAMTEQVIAPAVEARIQALHC